MGLPISSVAVRASDDLFSRRYAATRVRAAARSSKDVSRQRAKAARACASASLTCVLLKGSKRSITSPVVGLMDVMLIPHVLLAPPWAVATMLERRAPSWGHGTTFRGRVRWGGRRWSSSAWSTAAGAGAGVVGGGHAWRRINCWTGEHA